MSPFLDATPSERAAGKLRLCGLTAVLLVAGAALYAAAGPPRLPAAMPSLPQILRVLSSPSVPLDGVAYLMVTVAWLAWLWIVASVGLQLFVVGLELLAQGSAAVVALRQVANRVSVPIARRAVTAAFAVQVLTRAVPVAAAAPLDAPPAALVEAAPGPAAVSFEASSAPVAQYVVRARDTLWSIAETAYGSGDNYRRIVEANVGRRMPDGQLFTSQGVIQPGWVLDVPAPSTEVEQTDHGAYYTVEAGDTLSGIAARLLGDRERWSELFSLNQRVASLPDGRVLNNANLIWPGLRLRLPDAPDAATRDTGVPPPLAVAPAPGDPGESRVAEEPAPAPEADEATPMPPDLGSPVSLDLRAPDRADPDPGPHVVALSAIGPRLELSPPPVVTEPVEPTPEPHDSASPRESPLGLPLEAVLAAAGVAGLAGAAVFGARRLRNLGPLHSEPESEAVVQDGYAEAVLTPTLTHRLHGGGRADPVTTLAAHLLRYLREHGLDEVEVIAVRHGRSSTTLTLGASLADQARITPLAPSFAERLGAEAEAWVSDDQDLVLKLTHLRAARLLLAPDGASHDGLCLLPLGVLFDRQLLYAEWRALGHVLVASLPGHGADTILTSLLAALTARRSPDELRLWTLSRPRDLPASLPSLPHQYLTVDASDEQAVAEAVRHLRREVERRMAGGRGPELLVVVSELASLGQLANDLELVAHQGPRHGMRLVAATTDPAGLHSPLLPFFGTRLVLQAADEESSVALIGNADAAFLGGGGRLLLRLDARAAVELYGYRVAPEHLDRLVSLMRATYKLEPPPRPTPPPPPPPSPPPVEDEPPPPAPAAATAEPPPASPSVAEVAPPIEIICLGGPRVLHNGRQIWPARSADAKPWEVLLYVASHPAQGVGRDEVVGALWPDLPDTDGTHRLRQLRYRLRTGLERAIPGLNADPLRLESGGVLRLDSSIARSDAHAFLQLVDAARATTGAAAMSLYERARALYAGDLFASAEARRFAWLDERPASGITLREVFRHALHALTISLAQLYVQADRPHDAAQMYAELTAADPGDESLWRALFRALAQTGDRRALIREEQRMRQALLELEAEAQALGHVQAGLGEPSTETLRELERLLDSMVAERTPSLV